MSQGQLPISPVDRETLVRFFGELCIEVVRKYGISPGELINSKIKRAEVLVAREYLVEQLRKCVWRCGIGKRAEYQVSREDKPSQSPPPGKEWQPVGYMMLARLLGFDHSAIVLTIKRIEDRRREPIEWVPLPVGR